MTQGLPSVFHLDVRILYLFSESRRMSRNFKKLTNTKKRQAFLVLAVLYFAKHFISDSSNKFIWWNQSGVFPGQSLIGDSFFECKLLKPAVRSSWYKPETLSSPVTTRDLYNCASLTRRQKASEALTTHACRRNIEIFSSCKATSITLQLRDSSNSNSIRFTLNSSRNFGLVKVPGLGLERRDFSLDKKRTNNMASWGEGAKRLEIELRPVHDLCELHLNGLTYMVRAYHMGNLGHFYETIFRLFLELKSNTDLTKVKKIIILNAEKEVPFLALLEQLFPDVQIISPWQFSRKLVCVRNGVFVGFPNHALGRSDTSRDETNLFHEFLRERFKLTVTKQSSNKARPLVVFMSRNALPDPKRARRHLENEGEVAEILQQKTNWNVRTVSMQSLTMQEQAQLMYETNILISVHTGGFYNALYMQSGTIVIQINVPGTHFGTIEYENRPQHPFWMRGMWHICFERICGQRNIVFLEMWAEPDPLHSRKFVESKRQRRKATTLEYIKWASTNIEDFKEIWKLCGRGKTFFDCYEGIANEMRAHSTADKLSIKPTTLLDLIHPYISCIETRSCNH